MPEKYKIKSAEDLKKLLKSTGSSLKGTTFTETEIRVGQKDVPVIEVEKADGEIFLHPIDTE